MVKATHCFDIKFCTVLYFCKLMTALGILPQAKESTHTGTLKQQCASQPIPLEMSTCRVDRQSAVCWQSLTHPLGNMSSWFACIREVRQSKATAHRSNCFWRWLCPNIMSLHREACSYLHFQQEPFWSVYLNAVKMEMRCFIKLALDLSAVGLHMFTALSHTRLNNPNNLGKLKYSQRLAAIETTNATLITYTCYYVIGHTLQKLSLFSFQHF